MKSILITIKKMLGIDKDCDDFDTDLIININTIINILEQVGIGKPGFVITGETETWDDFLDDNKIELVKSYIYLRVKLLFDPPASSSITECIKSNISELEWRMSILDR